VTDPLPDRAVPDPAGLITDLVIAADPRLAPGRVRAVIAAVAGGRAKSRRLAAALAGRPAVLADGRSPAPRAVAELLVALRAAGAQAISPPCCAGCGKELRSFQRRGQDWYCASCGQAGAEPCAACGKVRPVFARDRAGQPRCAGCPDAGSGDPVAVICAIIAGLDPDVSAGTVAAAVRQAAPRPAYQQKLAGALEDHPALLTGEGHLAPLRAIPRFIEALHAAGVAGVVRPACGRCGRLVRIDKPLDGVRVCRTRIARSRREQCARCGASREPVTRDDQGKPVCANCFITDPANLETCTSCGRRRRVERRTPAGPLCPALPRAARADLLGLRTAGTMRDLPQHRAAVVPGLPAPPGCLLRLRPEHPRRLRDTDEPAVRGLHPAGPVGRLPGLQRPRMPPARPLRAVPAPQAARRGDGGRRRCPAGRAGDLAPRARRRRAPGNRDAVAGQALGHTRPG
jgi:hypothetical protein